MASPEKQKQNESVKRKHAEMESPEQHNVLDLPTSFPKLPDFDHLKKALQEKFRFSDIQKVSSDKNGYNFDANQRSNCPLCYVNKHENSKWNCKQICPYIYLVSNYSKTCQNQIMYASSRVEEILKDIIKSPQRDVDYAALFCEIYKGLIVWTSEKRFMTCQNNRWVKVQEEQVRNLLSMTLNTIFDRMISCYSSQKLWRQRRKKTFAEIDQKLLSAKKCFNFVGKKSNLGAILGSIRDQLFNQHFEEKLDSNVKLLGMDNGVFDLSTVEFKPCKPEYMISCSVGYDYFDDDNPKDKSVENEFDEFISQIYPVAEEKEIVQRYLGYCLLGNHSEKIFALFTDKREGYNGKSTMAKLILKSFGDYSTKGANELLYKTNSTKSVDSHSAGIIHYKGKRAAIFEELDPKRKLDNQRMKDYNGGNPTVEGRRIHSSNHVKFTWGTSMILMFNENNFPQFDCTDGALIERMIIIRHRSRFFTNEKEFENQKDEAYTYKAKEMDDRLQLWRPYFLDWCMEGLRNYLKKGFKDIPISCMAWKQELVNGQDIIYDFLQENTEDGDFVTQKELYERFCQVQPEGQERISSPKFNERVRTLWQAADDGIQFYKEKRIDGTKKKGVYLGKKLISMV